MNTIKELKRDLKIKNKWVFEEYTLNGRTFETKRFNKWFQIFRDKETGSNIPFGMYSTNKEIFANLERYNLI